MAYPFRTLIIAALYVQSRGCYSGLPDVDLWDEARDARRYAGPYPVVAHPPCARWCVLAGLVESRGGGQRGDDGGCFAAALAAVRAWGGVLEHPAESAAWAAFGLPRPGRNGWARDISGGWSTEVAQKNYGHRANKLTWLYAVGVPLKLLDWSRPGAPVVRVSEARTRGGPGVERMARRERLATPIAFRDLLLSIARGAR